MENPLTDLDESEDPPRFEAQGQVTKSLAGTLASKHIQTPSILASSSVLIKGYYVQGKAFLVLVQSDPDTLKGDQCHK